MAAMITSRMRDVGALKGKGSLPTGVCLPACVPIWSPAGLCNCLWSVCLCSCLPESACAALLCVSPPLSPPLLPQASLYCGCPQLSLFLPHLALSLFLPLGPFSTASIPGLYSVATTAEPGFYFYLLKKQYTPITEETPYSGRVFHL